MSKENKTSDKQQNGNDFIADVRRSFSMETALDFGKHKGKTIKQLFDEDEDSYLMWMYETFDADFDGKIETELEWRLAESNDLCRRFTLGLY